MTCRTCGTEIADKAIVCYRCGAPTETPRVAPPGEAVRGPWPLVAALAALALFAVLAVPQLAAGAPRAAGWTGAAVVAVLIVRWLRPVRRRSRLLGRPRG